MAVQDNTVKQRKKEASKTKFQKTNAEESKTERSESNFGTSNFRTNFLSPGSFSCPGSFCAVHFVKDSRFAVESF